MWLDPIVEEVRARGEHYVQQFNYDLDAIVEDLRKRSVQAGRKTVTFENTKKHVARNKKAIPSARMTMSE